MLIIGEIWRSLPNIQIIAPRVIPGTHTMEHFVITPETILVENKWGIPEPEPTTSQISDIQEIDMILVPLLAFDTKGFRVGYGGGFYDRFFPQCKSSAIKTGLSFFDPVLEIENLDKFDVALDYCITPSHTFHWRHSFASQLSGDQP